ncbi:MULTISPECIES: hypothetical protein [Pseudomonas]|uniref:hypothetical protein n=1 Tax=Pseudomonas TaxID=286 RepID=UPI00236649FE|nr:MULTISPECIES: hypothetical protein [Pseudomonas]WDG52208.1 hypothetical protein PUP76_20315 [Pseudomonas chlororaphis]WDH86775.1 hypothetical protein PUP74_21870 [Pseudomonas chlororaphis]WPO47674.1 hypothetical protein SHB59_00750 [Pseudomonas sp. S1Bt23]
MSLNTADKIFLVVGLVDFAGIFMVPGICLHMAYTKMDLMLDHLKNSAVLSTLTTLRHGAPGGIFADWRTVTFPGFHLKRGATETIVTPGLANGAATFTAIYPR